MWIRGYAFFLFLALSVQSLAQYDELIGACAVMPDDLILSEHIMSLHTGRVPIQSRAYIRSEVIRIKSNALRRENALLSQREANELAVIWLEDQLDQLENQDKEGFADH